MDINELKTNFLKFDFRCNDSRAIAETIVTTWDGQIPIDILIEIEQRLAFTKNHLTTVRELGFFLEHCRLCELEYTCFNDLNCDR